MSCDEQDFDEPCFYDDDDNKNALEVLHEAIIQKRTNLCRSCSNLENSMLLCNPPVLIYSCKAGIKNGILKETYEGKRKCEHFLRKNDIRVEWR